MAIDFKKYIPNQVALPKKSNIDFSKYIPKTSQPVKPVQTTQPIQPVAERTVKLPSGGVLKTTTNPQELVKTERSNYGGLPVKTGLFGLPSAERADIVPVSLGGVNAAPENITYEKYPLIERGKDLANKIVNSKLVNRIFPKLKDKVTLVKAVANTGILPDVIEKPIKEVTAKQYIPQTNTDKYLKKEILPAYKSGDISLREAQGKAISFLKSEQAGLKQGTMANLPSAVLETGKKIGKPLVSTALSGLRLIGNLIPTYKPASDLIKQAQETSDKQNAKNFLSGASKEVRAASTLYSAPLAGVLGAVDKETTAAKTMNESLNMAFKMISDPEINASHDVEVGAQRYLESQKIGKYGENKPTLKDIGVLTFLGFSDLFGDPLLSSEAPQAAYESLAEFAKWKKLGTIVRDLPEGTKFVTKIEREIPISNDLKMKIVPKEDKIVFKGYTKRFGKVPPVEDVNALTTQISQSTGMNVTSEIKGGDLIIKNTLKEPIIPQPKTAIDFTKYIEKSVIPETTKYKSAVEAMQSPEMKAKYAKIKKQQQSGKVTKTSNNLYHTTSAENLQSIAENGLTTGNKARFEGVSSPNKISFGANEATASYYGKDGDIMIRTKTSYKPTDLQEDLLAGGKGTYTTSKNIPPEMLELKQGNKWVSLKDYNKQSLPIKKTTKIDPLIQEAKGKSLEEFVKAQGTPVYRGEGGSNIAQGKALLAEGKHFASDAEYPKGFGKVGEYVIKPDAKVLDLGDSTFAEISQKLGIPERRYISPKELSDIAKSKGYSVLKYNGEYKSTGKQFTHFVDLTGDSTITKSQLTDIWNKAQEKLPEPIEQTTKPSGVAKSIEAKAIEQGLANKGFDQLAEFEGTSFKEQAKKVSDLMSDIDNVRAIVRGEKELPEGVRSAAVLSAMEDYAKEIGSMKQIESDIMSSLDRDFGGEMENQYQQFKQLFNEPKLRSPKSKEAITNGDLETFRRELVDRNVLTSEEVDNLTYSQEMSGDELLDKFKDRLMEEDPGLLVGRETAKTAGYGQEISNEAADLMYELANSPLTTKISESASEVSLARMREKDSATMKLQEIKKARELKAEKKGVKVKESKKQLKQEVEKVNLSKEELQWDKFLDEIIC